jgi:hypothetical protein
MHRRQFGIGAGVLDPDGPPRERRAAGHASSAQGQALAEYCLDPVRRLALVRHGAKCLTLQPPDDGTLGLTQSLGRCYDCIQDRLHLVG